MNIETRIKVSATPDPCWEVLGLQFGDIGSWATAIVRSRIDRHPQLGAERVCQLRGMGGMGPMEIREELVDFDEAERRLEYKVQSGLPKFILSARNRWAVEDNGDGTSTIVSHAKIKLAWYMVPMSPMMRIQSRRDLARVAEELKYRIEHGAAHPRKLEAISVAAAA
ncbi:MAG: SRPBCC family protein [Myxococcota bacterium]